jgi:hypothetical protein
MATIIEWLFFRSLVTALKVAVAVAVVGGLVYLVTR